MVLKIILIALLNQTKISFSSGYQIFWNDTLGGGVVISVDVNKRIKNKMNIGMGFKTYIMHENRLNFAVPRVYPIYFKNYLYILNFGLNISYGNSLWEIGPKISLSYIRGLYKAYNAIEITYYDIEKFKPEISLIFSSGNLFKGNFGVGLKGELGYLIRMGIYGNVYLNIFYLNQ